MRVYDRGMVWVIAGFVVLLGILFLAYNALRDQERLDNARRIREGQRETERTPE
jgi:hypothetical protein